MLPFPTAENKTLYYYKNIHDDKEWGSEIRDIVVCDSSGHVSLDNGYMTYAKVDTFSPFIQLPKNNFDRYRAYLTKKYPEMTCNKQEDETVICKVVGKTCESI
jgi:hypothetical protein